MRTPVFRDHPSFEPPRRGPLVGRRVLALVAPLQCDARGIVALHRALRPLGVFVAVTMECHGEAHGEDERLLFPNYLLIEAVAQTWDALVLAGGAGAARVAEDPFARETARRFAGDHRFVAALGEGSRVLSAARVDGFVTDDPRLLARELALRFGGDRAALFFSRASARRRLPSRGSGLRRRHRRADTR